MATLETRDADYGKKVLAVEPGGIEAIPEQDRHGKAWSLFALWTSPNLEFATIYVGALGVFFGLSLTKAILGVLLGNALGAISQYFLTKDGPRYGVPQMVVSRAAFGRYGNVLPSLFNALASGIGWFAVNSVSGMYALSSLTHMGQFEALIIIAAVQVGIAVIGHNLIQTIEKYLMPYLLVVFTITAIIVFTKHHVAHPEQWGLPGSFTLFVGAVFGYAAGWNPFASDYSRYLPSSTKPQAAGGYAALGLFIYPSLIQIAGVAAVFVGMHDYGSGNPVSDFTSYLPHWFGYFLTAGIVLGSVCANVLNIYSGAMSFVTMGLKLPINYVRAGVAVSFGIAGFFVANYARTNPANSIENFLLVMAYWIGPWLGVIFADKVLRRGGSISHLLFAKRENYAGPIAFVTGVVVSMLLFSNQTWYTGYFPKRHPGIGDIGFPVGFAIAFIVYAVIATLTKSTKDSSAQ